MNNKLRPLVLSKILVVFLLSFSSCFKSEHADLIIHNATIYTVDGSFSIAEAIAITGDSIVAIGSEREILNKYSATKTIDAKKRPVYPGFIDAHCHFLGYGLSLQQVSLSGTKSFKEVIENVVEFSKKNTSLNGWIEGRGWDQNDWETKQFPDKKELDSLFPETPVFLKRIDGHAALANNAALKIAGIESGKKIDGGIVETKNGELTGILIDNAIDLVADFIPSANSEQKTKALLDAQKNCFAAGLTTIDDAGLDKDEIELMDKLQKEGKLKMKIYAMLTDNEENFNHFLIAGPYRTERLNVRSFKFYGDGALGSRGACLLEPYSDVDYEHHGFLLKSKEYYRKYAEKLLVMGFQMNTHCIGDSTNRFLLEVYSEILKGTNDYRWRIEHAQVVYPSDFDKFRQYSIIPSVQPTHATSDMYWAKERLGNDRVRNAYAYKTLHDQLGFLALGTDFPVEGIEPIHTFYAAVARMDVAAFPENGFQPENALSREEALRGITIGAAIANFEEMEKGSLEVGKKADIVILDKDIMRLTEKELPQVKVLYTIVNGEVVFTSIK